MFSTSDQTLYTEPCTVREATCPASIETAIEPLDPFDEFSSPADCFLDLILPPFTVDVIPKHGKSRQTGHGALDVGIVDHNIYDRAVGV